MMRWAYLTHAMCCSCKQSTQA